MILIIGKNENVKTGLFDVRKANELSVSDLAKGGLGRVAVYTEEAVKELENKMEGKKK